MTKIKNPAQIFLSKLSILEYKYRILESNEECFNIFTALHKQKDEVHLHSRFLSVLLSPNGLHNKGDLFLRLFLNVIEIKDFDTNQSEVIPNEFNKSEYKEIDIFIVNRIKKQAIIIENKIDAGDSNHEDKGQLEGYFNLVQQIEKISKDNIKVIYLTLDGHEPTPASLGKYSTLENMNGRTIDYEHEIINWLNLCLKECSKQPFLRESIIQYQNLIQHMTNIPDIKECLEIRDLIANSEDNLKSAKLLIDNFKHIKWHTVNDFWKELRISLHNKGFEIICYPNKNDITNTTHFEPYKKDYSCKNNYGIKAKVTEGLIFWIWNGTDYGLYWGISKNDISEEYKIKLNEYRTKPPIRFETSETSIIWKYFDLTEEENIFFPSFSNSGTFNLIDSKYRNKVIEEKLVHEILVFINEIK